MKVNDGSDNRPALDPHSYAVTTAEHSAPGSTVALVYATDKDSVKKILLFESSVPSSCKPPRIGTFREGFVMLADNDKK